MTDQQQYERRVVVHRVITRRSGAVYRTEVVTETWVPLWSTPPEGCLYVSPSDTLPVIRRALVTPKEEPSP